MKREREGRTEGRKEIMKVKTKENIKKYTDEKKNTLSICTKSQQRNARLKGAS